MNIAKAALLFLLALVPTHALVTPEFQLDAPLPSLAAGGQDGGRVAFNGQIYIVAWHSQTNDINVVIRWKKFSASGQPLPEIAVFEDTTLWLQGIASNGDGFILMASRYRNGVVETFAYRLDAGGYLAATPPLGPVLLGDRPAIVSDGKDYLLYSRSPAPVFCRITDAGITPVTPFDPALPGGFEIAYGGSAYLAVNFDTSSVTPRIMAQRISPAGDLVGAPVEIGAAPLVQGLSVAFSSGVFLATWVERANSDAFGGKVVGRRVSTEGVVLDAGPITIVPGDNAGPALVAPNGNGFVVAHYYTDYVNEIYRLHAQRVSADGTIGFAYTLSERASTSYRDLAMNAAGPNTLLAWTIYLSGTDLDVLTHFIPADGSPQAAQIAQTNSNLQAAPAAAFGSGKYLVAWQDNRNAVTSDDDVLGMFLDANGRRIGAAFPIASGLADQSSPSVAAVGDRYLVAWRENQGDATDDDIKAALIINERVALQISICTETNSQRAPAVASNGKDFLVVWRDARLESSDDIYGMHVSRDGVVSGPVNGFPICVRSADQQAPAVASNGANYFVVWRENGAASDDIYGALVNPGDSTLPPNFPVSAVELDQRAPAVASNGTNYFVVWRDRRQALLYPRLIEIFGTPVSADGVVGNALGIPIAEPTEFQREPTIVASRGGYLVGWLQWTNIVYQPFARAITADGATNSPPIRLSETSYDADTLAFEGPGDGTALMLSQTDPDPRVISSIVCLSNCPVVLDVLLDLNGRTLTWNAEPSQTYRVEFKADLNSPNWQTLTESTASATGFLEAKDLAAASTRFYRILRVP